MKKTRNVEMTTAYLKGANRIERIRLLTTSNLTTREARMLVLRYVDGKTLKESAAAMGMEYEAFCKAQRRALDRLYMYLFILTPGAY
ncbi:MAG: hypothetical protein MJ196_09860 [Treponemataceae bacterium]|nr:hypothetical protein [Treponemataceae bacterium]